MKRVYFKWNEETDHIIKVNAKKITAEAMVAILLKMQPTSCINANSIRKRAAKIGVSLRKFGECHHSAKYPDLDIELIRQLDDEGVPRSEIGRKFGRPTSTISQICDYKFRLYG